MNWANPRQVSFLGCFLILISLCFSPAGITIGTVIMLVGGIWHAWTKKPAFKLANKHFVFAFWGLYAWVILAFFWTSDVEIYLVDLRIKLPYLLIPLAFALIPAFSHRQKLYLWAGYCLSQLAIGLFTVGGYLQNLEENIDLVKKNSALQIVGGTNHIYFGVTLALAILIGFHLLMNGRKEQLRIPRIIPLLYVILTVVCLHSLTSRTGLLAFYAGFLVYIFSFIIKHGHWKTGALLLILFALTPILSYQLIPSFKYRVDVTFWDLEYSSKKGADLNYQSVGLRLKTWQCCYAVWQENPIIGVGFADVGEELFSCYEEIGLNADQSKWLASAHNQYLEQLVGGGVFALLLLLTLFLLPLIKFKILLTNELFVGFLALLGAAMLTESFLERQLGINLFLLMYFLLLKKNE